MKLREDAIPDLVEILMKGRVDPFYVYERTCAARSIVSSSRAKHSQRQGLRG